MTVHERIKEIEEWLTKNGWAEKEELPDHIAANFPNKLVRKIYPNLDNQRSLAQMVYELIEANKNA